MKDEITLANHEGDQVTFRSVPEMFDDIRSQEVSCRVCKHVGRGGCPVNFVDVEFLCNQWEVKDSQ